MEPQFLSQRQEAVHCAGEGGVGEMAGEGEGWESDVERKPLGGKGQDRSPWYQGGQRGPRGRGASPMGFK